MLEINVPPVLAELIAAFDAYEHALVSDDIEALNNCFWRSSATTRYGIRESERQYGHAAIAEFRIRHGALNQVRTLRNRQITTFGHEFGTASTEFVMAGSDRIGRQSQTWVRFDGVWKIVSAHVSFGV
jgi:hypothetical protein